MHDADRSEALQEAVREALAARRPLRIVGGDTRRAWLPADAACRSAEPLHLAGHRGIVHFEASELVVTARCGTPLAELETTLAAAGQMLTFDPPRFDAASTLGGALATGLSGPSRPWRGAARDAVLGVRLLDGHGASGRFGGEVMKNVAGYDVSRLVTGAWGTLGVMLDASLRVCSLPEQDTTVQQELGLAAALQRMTALQRRPLPIVGLAWSEGVLRVRLAGTGAGVRAAVTQLGGDVDARGQDFWCDLRDLRLPLFHADGALWRLSLPANAAQPAIPANWLLDWGGAQRWCITDASADRVHEVARAAGGHALRVRPDLQRAPLSAGVARLTERIRGAMDPSTLFNAGALYPAGPA
ncbi:MAG TPA: glycolate oxidase subunit GlcE [Pseudomonadales bacterium]|nr:glycolate oxidase subunit GlcE [Pseudomonadales bacterium]